MRTPNLILCFACKVDFDYHLGHDAHGMEIYFSLKSIKHRRPCVGGCGIVAFPIDKNSARLIQPENWEAQKAGSKTIDEWIQEERKELEKDFNEAKARLDRHKKSEKARAKRKKEK